MKGFQTYFTFLERNKLFTFVNVAGLSISLMFVLLIANMVTRQLTIDKDLKDADRISIFANEVWAGAHYNLGDRLASRYPEIEDWCALRGHEGVTVITDNNPVTAQLMSVRKTSSTSSASPCVKGTGNICLPTITAWSLHVQLLSACSVQNMPWERP